MEFSTFEIKWKAVNCRDRFLLNIIQQYFSTPEIYRAFWNTRIFSVKNSFVCEAMDLLFGNKLKKNFIIPKTVHFSGHLFSKQQEERNKVQSILILTRVKYRTQRDKKVKYTFNLQRFCAHNWLQPDQLLLYPMLQISKLDPELCKL